MASSPHENRATKMCMSMLPGFLVIGAMKCGTTTLYNDLRSHGSLHLPEKENNVLSAVGATTATSRDEYERIYRGQAKGQLGGDVSTTYSMLPDCPGVPKLAREVLGRDLRVIYLVRNPLDRAVSHHYHMHSRLADTRRMEASVDESVASRAEIVDYSRYAMQLSPWRDCFPEEQIRVIVFGEYVKNRRKTVSELCDFLGVSDQSCEIEADKAFNQSDGKPVLNYFWSAIYEATWYQKGIRPLMPVGLKGHLCRWVLPKAPARPEPPSSETVQRLLEAVRDDAQELARSLGRSEIWDLEETAQRIGRDELAAAA